MGAIGVPDAYAGADLVVRGRRREDGAEVYVVVEVSWGVGSHDVERAVHRAALLAQLGLEELSSPLYQAVVSASECLPQALHRIRIKCRIGTHNRHLFNHGLGNQ